MSDTFCSSGGSGRTTSRSPSIRLRLAGFAAAVAGVALLIVLIDTNIWEKQAAVQEGFAAIKAEKFYVGVNFRTRLRLLTEGLLYLHLTGTTATVEELRREAQELKDWLRQRAAGFTAPAERAAFDRLTRSYDEFVTRIDPLLRPAATPLRREDFPATFARVGDDARPVLDACEDLSQVERRGFEAFFLASDRTLLRLQQLFLLSLLLLVALAATLAVLVYRGMIAPLRAQLSESQDLIARQEKLAALGALGTGVAHEIRNPLTAIKFRLFSLKRSLPPAFAETEDVHVIGDEIARLDRIVKDFLQFARPSEPALLTVPAERILKEVHDLMQAELHAAAIQLRLDIRQPAWIQADTQQIKQVLINLVQNSADSIGTEGTVTLRLTHAVLSGGGPARPAASLAVADTGKGIPLEVQKRLFDPFFTTKEGGTGLGLAIAARIIEKHGGALHYRTEVNRGTVFEILLPRAEHHGTENPAH